MKLLLPFLVLLFGTALQSCAQTSTKATSPAKATSTGPARTGEVSPTLAPGTEATRKVSPEPPAMRPAPQPSDAEMELFLKTASIESQKVLDTGTTKALRVTLNDGKLRHDAQFQAIDVFRSVFRGREGTVEKNFRDTYKFNIAAYRLGKLLGIANMIPMSVERTVDNKLGSMTWWLDNIWMTEAERRDNQIKPPATQFWVDQLNIVRVFDQLIYNTDRNQGNLLITPEWKLWMIDHTRAFRAQNTLLKRESLGRCDYKLLDAMKKLNTVSLKQELGAYLRPEEISGLLARRDLIVRHYDQEIKTKGQDSVLTGIPRRTPEASLP